MASSPVVIRKYGNRRLYDTSASRYVNLEDIAAMVRNGTEVQVVDANSGEDITRVVLTQIVMEDSKDQPAALPLDLLRQLIMATDTVGREFMMWYLKSALDSYHNVQSAVQSGFAQMGSAALSPLETISKLVQGARPQPPETREVDELRRRIAELEARLATPKKKSKPRRKSKARAGATANR